MQSKRRAAVKASQLSPELCFVTNATGTTKVTAMPWKAKDATKHTKKANTSAKKEKFAKTANAVLKKTGNEGKAVRIANAAVKKSARKR